MREFFLSGTKLNNLNNYFNYGLVKAMEFFIYILYNTCAMETLLILFLIVLAILVYFFPSIVARKKENFLAIFVLNLFLGWVVALIWAVIKEKKVPHI